MKRKLKTLFVLLLSLCILSGGTVLAEGEEFIEQQIIPDSKIEEQVELELNKTEEISLAQAQSQTSSNNFTSDSLIGQVLQFDLDEITKPMTRSTDGSITDSIDTEGSMKAHGIFYLEPGQILQVGLECPKSSNLDYDLLIGEVDTTTGNITPLAGSTYATYFNTYPDGQKTLDEGMDYINTSSTRKAYAAIVHAKVGGGQSFPYTLYYSLDAAGNFMDGEHDQNAAYVAYTLKENQYVQNIPLNSPSDVDWFGLSFELPSEYRYADIDIHLEDNNGYSKLEVYEHIGSNQMKLLTPVSGTTYRFTYGGTFYLRVFANDRNNFAWHTYKLTNSVVNLETRPRQLEITGFATDKDPNGSNYASYLGTRAYNIHTTQWFDVKGVVKDAFGNPVKAGLPVTVNYVCDAWEFGNPNRNAFASGKTNADGTFSVRFRDLPPGPGKRTYTGAAGLQYYDLCDVTVYCEEAGYIKTLYRFAFWVYG